MNPRANIVARQAIDECASAIQNLARAFTNDRTPHAVREDLQRARERLSAAMQAVTDAIAAFAIDPPVGRKGVTRTPLTADEISDAFAEGMEAAHCGLLMKDGPRAHNGRRSEAWRAGYRQAMQDCGDYPAAPNSAIRAVVGGAGIEPATLPM